MAANPNRKRRWTLWLTGIAALSCTAGFSLWLAHREPLSRHELKQRQLTANSSETSIEEGSISSDGRYLAYYDVKGIHLKRLETGETRTVPEAESLKGRQVDWALRPLSGTKFLGDATISGQSDSTWIVPVEGGPPRKLRDNAEPWSPSPDGSSIAFTTNSGRIGSREIWLMHPNGEHPRKVLGTDENSHVANVKWSPDGKRVAFLKEHRRGDQIEVSLESVDLAGRTPITLLSGIPLWAGYAWLPDWRLIYSVAAPDINGLTCNFWEVRVDSRTGKPISKPESLTDWAGSCTGELSVTSDGKRAIFNKWWAQLNVYVADLASGRTKLSTPRRLTLSSGREHPVGWTQDSKAIVFVSNSNGTWGIFKQQEGEEAAHVVLKRLESSVQARMSPDRKWVLYQEFTGLTSGRLMRVPASGGIPQFVSTLHSASEESPWFGGRAHQPPRCADSPARLCAIAERSANGTQLVFTAVDLMKGRGSELMRIPIDPRAAYVWDLSPDGTRIAILRRGEGQIHVLSLSGQTLLRIAVRGWSSLQTVNWAVDGKGLFLSAVRQGSSVLLHVDLQGKANILWEQPGEQEGQLDTYALPSPDGRHLAILGWTLNSNMWLMEGF